ncbi:MAG: M20/M25/M40 family metallo-hydrolase [Acidobacteriota bacterium]
MKRVNRIVVLLILTALAAAAIAQSPAQTNAPSIERLRAHIEYLASDKLEGRRTGSPGANLAAEYIAREFSRYGLRRSIGQDLPGMSILEADSPRRYMQEFPYVAGVELGKNNLILLSSHSVGGVQIRVGEDWMPLGFSSNASIKAADLVFVGYGISSAELKYDDYAVTNAKGRVAIAFAGTPDGDNPHGQFAHAGEIRFKAAAARAAGALALLIIANEEILKDDRLSHLSYNNSGEAGIPVGVISRQLAKFLLHLPNPEMKLSELEKSDADARLVTAKPEKKPDGEFTFPPGLFRGPVKGLSLSISTDLIRREVEAANVVGILGGSDPTLKNEVIVIGAHYDHLGRGGEGSLAPREGDIHHGADDNASGVAGMLELARIFKSQELRPRRTIVFMAYSGEEEGLLGSNYYVNHPIVPLANTVAMINMDMIGRMKDNKLIVGGVGTAPGWRQLIGAANAPERINVGNKPQSPRDMPRPSGSALGGENPMLAKVDHSPVINLAFEKPFDLTLNEDGFGPSDHSSFYAKQVPVLFFWTGSHEDYHKPSDTADKINYADEARILKLVARVIYDIDTNDKRPVYTVAKSESTGRSMGFRVYLGTIPNYADSNDGLLLDGVRDDSPASKAGIEAGDKIVKLAGRDVRNVYDYTYALGEMKAGQEYEVELMRGGERIKLVITPAARK